MGQFLREYFDHLLLTLLGVLGGVAGAWATAHNWPKTADWFFTQAGMSLGALLMRMQPGKASQVAQSLDKSPVPPLQ